VTRTLLFKLLPRKKVWASILSSWPTRPCNSMARSSTSLPPYLEGSGQYLAGLTGQHKDICQGLWAKCVDTATQMKNLVTKIDKDPPFHQFTSNTQCFWTISAFLKRLQSCLMHRNCTVSWQTEVSTACLLVVQVITLLTHSKCSTWGLIGSGSQEMSSG